MIQSGNFYSKCLFVTIKSTGEPSQIIAYFYPWGLTYLSQHPSHFSKQSAKSSLSIYISCFLCFLYLVYNLLTFNSDFHFEKTQKLQGVKSELSSSQLIWMMWSFIKKIMHEIIRIGIWNTRYFPESLRNPQISLIFTLSITDFIVIAVPHTFIIVRCFAC